PPLWLASANVGVSSLISLPVAGSSSLSLIPRPERPEREKSAAVSEIDAKWVDSVEVVASGRLENQAPVLPAFARFRRVERRVGHQADGARVAAEAREA